MDDGANSTRSGRVEYQAVEQQRLTDERRTAVDEDDELDEEHERVAGRVVAATRRDGTG